MRRTIAIVLCVWSGSGCGLIWPSCTDRQKRGTVSTLSGEVGAGDVTSHRVAYETRGSQNDVSISWPGHSIAGGPHVRLYATAVECSQFRAPPAENSAACAVLATGGWNNGFVSPLILTHGRGNPETLGSPPEYKLWVVGDSVQATRYTISITWFYGPDC